jgi:hypothetical protein
MQRTICRTFAPWPQWFRLGDDAGLSSACRLVEQCFTSHVHVVDRQPGKAVRVWSCQCLCGRSQTIGRRSEGEPANTPGQRSHSHRSASSGCLPKTACDGSHGAQTPGCTAFRAPRGVLRHLFFQGSLADPLRRHDRVHLPRWQECLRECGEAAIQVLCPSVNDFYNTSRSARRTVRSVPCSACQHNMHAPRHELLHESCSGSLLSICQLASLKPAVL